MKSKQMSIGSWTLWQTELQAESSTIDRRDYERMVERERLRTGYPSKTVAEQIVRRIVWTHEVQSRSYATSIHLNAVY